VVHDRCYDGERWWWIVLMSRETELKLIGLTGGKPSCLPLASSALGPDATAS
jgi:hypothetical protein